MAPRRLEQLVALRGNEASSMQKELRLLLIGELLGLGLGDRIGS